MTSTLLYYHMKQTMSLSVVTPPPQGSPVLECSLVLTREHMLEALGGCLLHPTQPASVSGRLGTLEYAFPIHA